MNPRTIGVALSLLFALFAVAGSASLGAQDLSPAQAAAIRQGVQGALDAIREHSAAGRWDDLLRLYADEPDFRWISNGAVAASSVAEIRKYYKGLAEGTRVEQSYQNPEITPVAPGVAEVVTPFQTRLVDPKGPGFSFGGFLTMTFVQRADGWKILRGHASGRQNN